MVPRRRVEFIALGDELLMGLRQNAHLAFIGDQLVRHGLTISRSHEIRDDAADIAEVFGAAWHGADLLITTGGLGPTEDDITRETVAGLLERPLAKSDEVERALRKFFADRGRTPTENNLRQTYLIEGAEALPNPNGTAPGQWLEADGKILVMLPGPAQEMRPMFVNEVLPRLTAAQWVESGEAYLQLRTTGIGESQIAHDLEPILQEVRADVSIAYCAHDGMVDVRLSPRHAKFSRERLQDVAEACREILGDGFAAYGDPCVSGLILGQLRAMEKSIAVAESCTGGLLASHLTDVTGASKVFHGGVVCYRNEVKEQLLGVPRSILAQHGAVSAETAIAMATGAAELLEADYGVSVTGFAGPEGGNEPVGTVFVGFHSPDGIWCRKAVHPGSRSMVKQRAVNAALDFVRRQLLPHRLAEAAESLPCA